MPTIVTRAAPLEPHLAEALFARRLALETDCADVQAALHGPETLDFVLLDVRGPNAYAAGHVPGALNLPHAELTADRMAAWPMETVFVVYCAGPHCNGADRAGLRLARLGRRVKLMLGGITGWQDEGFALEVGRTERTVQPGT